MSVKVWTVLTVSSLAFLPACKEHSAGCVANDVPCDASLFTYFLYQSITPTLLLGDSAGNVFTTHDGQSWTRQTISTFGITALLHADSTFWALTADTAGIVYFSPDGYTWFSTTNGLGSAETLGGIADGNGRYALVGGAGSGVVAHYSSDGLNWTQNLDAQSQAVSFVGTDTLSFEGGTFVGGEDSGGQFMFASDGIDWFAGCSSTSNPIGITYHQGTYYAGDGGVINIGSTVGGVCPQVTAVSGIRNVESNGARLIAVGDNGSIYTSPDAASWSSNLTPGGTAALRTITAEENDLSIAAGDGGTYYVSRNQGVDWAGPYTLSGAANIEASATRAGFQ